MRTALSAVAVWCALLGAATASDWSWHSELTPHFDIRQEMAFAPPGFAMSLEKIHSRLRLDLAGFSPWMSKERLKLYLYKDRQSYADGQFKPPPWSNGISIYEKRVVAVYDGPDRRKLLQVIAHETTHLFFESYWGEVGRQPPAWINEGLAMVEEADPEHPEQSDWFQAMVYLPQTGYMHVGDLVKLTPTLDLKDNKPGVEVFYTESYSLAYFLIRQHSRLQFKNLCSKLRDGTDLDEALWLTYRYRGTAQLEKAWLEWLEDPNLRSRAEAAALAAQRRRDAEAASTASAFAPPPQTGPKLDIETDSGGASGDSSSQDKAKPRRFGAIDGFKPLGQ